MNTDEFRKGTYYLGVDLGMRQDHSAIAVVRAVEEPEGPYDFVRWRQPVARRLRVGLLERLRLGTAYRSVVARVREIARRPEMLGRCQVVVDATGVGMPVVEMLREADLGSQVVPVTITSGMTAHRSEGVWHVPRQELLQRVLGEAEKGLVVVERSAQDREALMEEMRQMRDGTGRESGRGHDDLVFAVALGCWRAGRWGSREQGRLF